MHIAHIFACGMGGIRTTGDLVAWMQLIKKMKLAELAANLESFGKKSISLASGILKGNKRS